MLVTVQVIITLLAAAVVAVPTWPDHAHNYNHKNVNKQKNDVCGSGDVKCCNSGAGKKGGLLNAQDLLDFKCSDVGVPVLGGGDFLKSKCKGQPVCCKNMHQSGLVNTGCTPVQV